MAILLLITGVGMQRGMAQNTYYGDYAAENITDDNALISAFGYQAGMNTTDGNKNSFFGYQAGKNANGDYNSVFGSKSGTSLVDGKENSFFGTYAGNTIEGSYNTLIGFNAGRAITAADGNTFIGRNAGYAKTSGDNNVFIGRGAGINNTSGHANVFIGYQAGANADDANMLIIENSSDLDHPLLYGNFDSNKLGIATSNLVDETTLSVAGDVHIGPYNEDPTPFSADLADSYLLWVEKGVVTEDFLLASVDHWSDFVFDEGYDLRSLPALAAFIQKHGHLPEIPSAEEVKAKGYTVQEINQRLLQKIEELVLYTIAQEEAINTEAQLNQAQTEKLTQEVMFEDIMHRIDQLEDKMR